MLWELNSEQWLVSFGFICCSAFITGWISDKILGYSGFGPIGNWLLLLCGAYVGLYCLNVYGYRLHWDPYLTVGVAFSAGFAMLVMLMTVKAAFRF